MDAGVHLLAAYGTTEVGPLSVVKEFEEDVKEWAWFRFSDLVKVRWEPQADGTFELHVLVRFSFAFLRQVVIFFP